MAWFIDNPHSGLQAASWGDDSLDTNHLMMWQGGGHFSGGDASSQAWSSGSSAVGPGGDVPRLTSSHSGTWPCSFNTGLSPSTLPQDACAVNSGSWVLHPESWAHESINGACSQSSFAPETNAAQSPRDQKYMLYPTHNWRSTPLADKLRLHACGAFKMEENLQGFAAHALPGSYDACGKEAADRQVAAHVPQTQTRRYGSKQCDKAENSAAIPFSREDCSEVNKPLRATTSTLPPMSSIAIASPADIIQVKPRIRRRKVGSGDRHALGGRPAIVGDEVEHMPVALTPDALRACFGLPLHEAARSLGICATAVKRCCRRIGIKKWPFQLIKPIRTRLVRLKSCSSTTTGNHSSCSQPHVLL